MSDQKFRSRKYFESLSVLIVEDNRFFRSLLRTILREFGLRSIDEVENGADALVYLKSSTPDIILLDWHMPVFSGTEFMQVFNDSKRPGYCSPAIIVVTANATQNNVMDAARMGVDGILAKPIVPALLYKRILEVLAPVSTGRTKIPIDTQHTQDSVSENPSVPDEDGDRDMVIFL